MCVISYLVHRISTNKFTYKLGILRHKYVKYKFSPTATQYLNKKRKVTRKDMEKLI